MSITNPTEGRQLLAKAIRDSQRVDTIGDTVSFTMKVLSTPVPRSSEDMGAVFGGDPVLDIFEDPIEDRLQFKGRIEGEYFMSPHICIPDPCNIYGATNSTIAAYQSLHTTCITPKGFSNSLKIGDRVRVTCRKGDFKMDLQFANVDSVETSMMSVQTETEIQECQILSTRFADGSDFLDNLGSSTSQGGNSTGLGSPVSAGSVEYDLSPLMTRIRNGDSTLWPAKVLNVPGKPEINQMYSPCVLGQEISSRPQTARILKLFVDGELKARPPRPHKGVDISLLSGESLYACFPGKISYNAAGKESAGQPTARGWQPTTEAYASLTIVSKLEFATGEVATITTSYGHVREFQKLSGDGIHVIASGAPDSPVLVGYSGGAAGDPGNGTSTGAHLHWELYDSSHSTPPRAEIYKDAEGNTTTAQGAHYIYRGAIKDPVHLQFSNEVDIEFSEMIRKAVETLPLPEEYPASTSVYGSVVSPDYLAKYGIADPLAVWQQLPAATEEADLTAMVVDNSYGAAVPPGSIDWSSTFTIRENDTTQVPPQLPWSIGVHDTTTEYSTTGDAGDASLLLPAEIVNPSGN